MLAGVDDLLPGARVVAELLFVPSSGETTGEETLVASLRATAVAPPTPWPLTPLSSPRAASAVMSTITRTTTTTTTVMSSSRVLRLLVGEPRLARSAAARDPVPALLEADAGCFAALDF